MKFSRAKLQHLKWVRRKELIRINCFIMIAILLMVLLFMGFPIVSNAESAYTYEDTVMSHLHFTDSDLLISRNVNQESGYVYFLYSDTYVNYFDNDMTNGAIIWDSSIDNFEYTYQNNQYTIADCQSYKMYFNSSSSFVIDFFPEQCIYKMFRENANSSGLINMFYCYPYEKDGNNYPLPSPNYSIRVNFAKNSDGNFYLQSTSGIVGYNNGFSSSQRYINRNYCAYGNYTNSNCICTNCPIYALPEQPYLARASHLEDPNDNTSDTVTDWLEVSGIQVNPNYGGSSGTNNSADIKDHLALYENSVCYLVPNTMDNGDFYIYANFDQEQKNNPNNYIVCVDCNIYYSFNYNNGASFISKTNNGQPLKNLFSLNNNAVNIFSTSSRVIRPVSEFNNSKVTIPLSEFNQNAVLSNDYSITEIAQALSNTCSDANAFVTVLQAIGGFNVMGNKVDLSSFTQNGYDCVPVSIYYNFDVSIIYKTQTDVTLSEESSLSYTYDFISGQGNLNYSNLADDQKVKEATDSQTIPPAYNYDTNKPTYNNTLPSSNNNDNSSSSNSNSSDNITVSGGDNSINNIVNVNQGNKYPEKGVMQSFVRIINNDKNNTVNDLTTLTGANNYIALMNNALSVIPNEVWQIWITSLKAILGIVVSALFLKILINWAT